MRVLEDNKIGIFVIACTDELTPILITPGITQILSVYKTTKDNEIDYRIKLCGEIEYHSNFYPIDYSHAVKVFYYRIPFSEYQQLLSFGIPKEYDQQPCWTVLEGDTRRNYP